MNRIWNPVSDGANRLFTGRHNQPKKLTITTDTQVQRREISKNQSNVKLRPLGSLENNSKQLSPQREIMKRGVKPSSANKQNQEKEEGNLETRASKAKCHRSNLEEREETVKSPSSQATAGAKEEVWRDKNHLVPQVKCRSGPKKIWMITTWWLVVTRAHSLASAKTSS